MWLLICQDLADVGSKLQQEGKKRKLKDLHAFGTWIVDTEAPKLHSKEQVQRVLQGVLQCELQWVLDCQHRSALMVI